jgi:hypothetical protein
MGLDYDEIGLDEHQTEAMSLLMERD